MQQDDKNKNIEVLKEAKKRYHLTDIHIQMARDLGLNPKKFGSLANNKQEKWKSPLSEFIEGIYFKHFKKEKPDIIKKIRMKITVNYIYVTIEGDYYQVCFDEKEDDGSTEITNAPYFLIQRQFEMPDGGEIYIESHDDNYIGHFKVKESILQRDKFTIELKRPKFSYIEISFNSTENKFNALRSALKIMVPNYKEEL
jgi:hypothetical protein